VYDQIENKLALQYEYLGEQEVKNIAKPVRVYRVVLEPVAAVSAKEETSQKSKVESAKSKVESAKSKVESAKSKVESPQSKVESPKPHRVGTTVFVLVFVSVLLLGGSVVVRYLLPLIPNTQHPAPSTPPPLSTQDSALRTEAALSPSPPPNTQHLAPSPQAAPAALPLPDKPSLIVLPLNNMSGDPGQDYFSDGLTEVLTSNLSKISSLFVIARNTAFTYKGKAANVQDVGREMGVRYVLEGSVQKADQQVRIIVQLIDATTGGHLWAEQYDRPLKDIFALQDDIVQQIVTTLKLQLTLQEQGYIVRKHTNNLEAYDAFLCGMEYFFRTTKEANTQARQLFEKAIALDPQYAEAYAWLSVTYWLEWGWRWSANPQTLERAFELAQQAVALDDSLPIAHSVLSLVYTQQQQSDQAIAEGERAIVLDPNNADSYAMQAEPLSLAGRPEDALRVIEQAMRLNPRYPPNYLFYLGLAYRLTGRYSEAIATLKEAISRSPNLITAHLNLAISYLLQWVSQQSPAAQTLEPAMAAIQRALALNDSFHFNHIVLGFIYLSQQQYEQEALAEMERGVALAPNEAVSYAALDVTIVYECCVV
jgi:TolB-like protein/lipoprotein NlpI